MSYLVQYVTPTRETWQFMMMEDPATMLEYHRQQIVSLIETSQVHALKIEMLEFKQSAQQVEQSRTIELLESMKDSFDAVKIELAVKRGQSIGHRFVLGLLASLLGSAVTVASLLIAAKAAGVI